MSDRHFTIGATLRWGDMHLDLDDRRRHLGVFGKSGCGKSTLLERLVIRDLQNDWGVCYLDPHGDSVKRMLNFVPVHRTNDTLYFDPTNPKHSVGLNIFEDIPAHTRPLAVEAVVSLFSHLFNLTQERTPLIKHYLRYSVAALIEASDVTLAHFPFLFTHEQFRERVLSEVTNEETLRFWREEYPNYPEKERKFAAQPINTRIKAFLLNPLVRNIFVHKKSTFDIRKMMDEQKIILVNLAEGQLGEEATNLIGSVLVSKIQNAAMSRSDIEHEEDRPDFALIGDEFHKFSTQSFISILAEARKMRLSLTVAEQYRTQTSDEIFQALEGNMGGTVVFRVGVKDAEYFAKAMDTSTESLTTLAPFSAYASSFSRPSGVRVDCLPPIESTHKRTRGHLVENASRRQFTVPNRLVKKWATQIYADPQMSVL